MDISPVASQTITAPTSLGGATVAASNPSPNSGQASSALPASIPATTDAVKSAAGAQPPSAEQQAQAVKQINDSFAQRGQNLYAAFEKDEATGIDVVKIVDKNSKETIAQYPSKAILGIAQSIQEAQGSGGQLIHSKA